MEVSYIICERVRYSKQSTLGKILLSNDEYENLFFCYSLEDTVRAYGVKVKNHTAIPVNHEGYDVAKTVSNRFKREMLILYTDPRDLSLEVGGIRFTGIRNHGGNDHGDTSGCPLTAYNLVNANGGSEDFVIQGRSDLDLIKWYDQEVAKGRKVKWIVKNFKQEG